MANSSVPQTDERSPADPIDELIASGISARTLIAHFLLNVEWLAAHRGDTFKLCYFGAGGEEAGEVVVETVKGAAALMQRAKFLGWTARQDEPTELGAPDLFEEAMHYRFRGTSWYATAIAHDAIDSNRHEGMPLGLPAKTLEAARGRYEVHYSDAEVKKRQERAKAWFARQKARRVKEREAKYRGDLAAAIKLRTDAWMAAAELCGGAITRQQARRMAHKSMRECNDGEYEMWIARGAKARAGGA
ncbi:hypothetical protein [Pseudoxanthomonas sp. X-1]|uniref:hypothetical protein n=1 Tax=Pseudoxanthomonas sp. X-1 TaxID=2571115 RepID=UPI00110B7CB1|nr:hypothetical protein [Pseudoxanthomonas sp. X-1]TMN24526.1 hypothetical protein FF950_05460 [Pseudoxanthomonas sp. X-1]UAY75204.1 hypothetical protein LAJ50_02765 [Pseudoxanthomonas sp. X-1]